MSLRPLRLSVLFSLVAVVMAAIAAPASASPDGDDDPTYSNAGTSFGTQYSSLFNPDFYTYLTYSQPVTDQASDGASVTATLLEQDGIVGRASSTQRVLRLTRFDINGQPGGLGGNGIREIVLSGEYDYRELLDIREVADGTFVVLIRATGKADGDTLVAIHVNADGGEAADSPQTFSTPEACEPRIEVRGEGGDDVDAYISAARVNAGGAISALWDCYPEEERQENPGFRGISSARLGVFVAQYAGGTETDSVQIGGVYGEDLELGPGGNPYALVADNDGAMRGGRPTGSVVHRVPLTGTDLTAPTDDPAPVPGNPVDLAVDSQGRPLVWTKPLYDRLAPAAAWSIYRQNAARTALDGSWGTGGHAEVTDPRLATPYSGGNFRDDEQAYLTVRPGDKVLATDGYQQQDTGQQNEPRELNDYRNGIIAGLTSGGTTDTGFATGGFKVLEYTGDGTFDRIGEPTLQSDAKVLIPHTDDYSEGKGSRSARITSPPGPGLYVGVTRLVGVSPSAPSNNPSSRAPLAPSSTPTICGRRAISLVRADVKGRRVKLTGLVGAALYGKRVTIQTDPKGAKSSKFTRTATVTASRTGAFTASVPRPKRSDFVSVRYRAVSGTARSPVLKLPQRLTSRSVKSAKGTITVKGKVKKSVLGKRNKVKIRRLVCGRYRTVGSAKPDANGNYTVTFRSTSIRGVAFYRAESMVLRKPGSKKYVIQYARAIAIKTTSQTG